MWPSKAEILGVGFQKTIPGVNRLILTGGFGFYGNHRLLLSLFFLIDTIICVIFNTYTREGGQFLKGYLID